VSAPKKSDEKDTKKRDKIVIDFSDDEDNTKTNESDIKEEKKDIDLDKINFNNNFENDNFKKMDDIKEGKTKGCLFEVDLHPEKRMKNAWNDYLEKNLPIFKEIYPNQRRQVLINLISKEFEKAPENPKIKQKLILQDELFKSYGLDSKDEKQDN